jgi:hypothetical protein
LRLEAPVKLVCGWEWVSQDVTASNTYESF